MRRTGWMLPLALGLACASVQKAPDDPRVADLVQARKVRVGLGLSPLGATKDPATGELKGVAVDLARALAARLGAALVPIEYPSPPKVLDGLETGAWDVGIFALDPSRRDQVDFSPPYLQVDSTYLVPPESKIRTVADADQPGIRIAVARNGVEEIALRGTLKNAQLVVADTTPAGLELLRTGGADALGSSRTTLLQMSARLPGARVLDDRFGVIQVAMAVPKGRAGRAAYVDEFIEEAKASGLVQRAIERAGLHGAEVAPPAKPGTR